MTKQLTAQEIAALTGGELKGNPAAVASGVAALKEAAAGDVSFLGNRKYQHQVDASQATIFIVPPDFDGEENPEKAYIVCSAPDMAFTKVVMVFAPEPIKYAPGVHPSAVVAPTVKIGPNVHIGANVVIDEGAEIGAGTAILPGCWIGAFTKIGRDGLIYGNVSIRERCIIGDRFIVHSGTTIGSDGFGFAPDPRGAIIKIPQVGIVVIGNDVEIGANCTIDRARFGQTRIGNFVKIDNLVQVAHNVHIGDCTMLISQCGIAGSAEIGRGVIIAAKAGINGHISIGDGCKVAGTAGVVKSLPPGSIAIGTPAESQREFMARVTLPKKVAKLEERLKQLEAELAR
ncbi:MAG: UDP-3-O-(3-hydroxymyristoyl)glucosamine N-acyltransferase [Victivallales bacterium]|nr:UDP-3-O-(3-hydroxymyristoyl)glucosamine N-acyltransferase [Victivallales bacterium]